MTGILIINKPEGITSHSVVSRVRRILNTKKVGHAGTLDPIATGVLVVLVGRATKLSDVLLSETKRYEAEFVTGMVTDTYDTTGTVVSRTDKVATEADIRAVLPQFTGELLQVPPMYSAIKKDGRKLYEYAREGKAVEVTPRRVNIFSIEYKGGNLLDVVCSKGTYIRSLIHDIGQALGCGACMSALKRVASGDFTIDDCCTLEELEEKGFESCALSVDRVLGCRDLLLEGEKLRRIKNGNYIESSDYQPGYYNVKDENGCTVCYAVFDGRRLRPEIMMCGD